MRRTLVLVAIAALSAPSLHAAGRLKFQYTIELQREGQLSETSFLRGFQFDDGVRLRVKLDQSSYCYVMMRQQDGSYDISYAAGSGGGATRPSGDSWAKLPKTTFMSAGNESVDRMYLVVANSKVKELEDAIAAGGTGLTESLALEVRDRYVGAGSYRRDLEGDRFTVSFKPTQPRSVVVVEEISLRRFH